MERKYFIQASYCGTDRYLIGLNLKNELFMDRLSVSLILNPSNTNLKITFTLEEAKEVMKRWKYLRRNKLADYKKNSSEFKYFPKPYIADKIWLTRHTKLKASLKYIKGAKGKGSVIRFEG